MSTTKGYSTKQDGSMYLSATDQCPENIANRKRYFDSLGFADRKIVAANLIHGAHIEIITHASDDFILDTDALITKEEGIVLTLTGADCFPVFFEEKASGIIALAHCGWRGVSAGIIPKTLTTIETLGGTVKDTLITIGPGICAKHFEIKEDVLPSFLQYPEFILRDETMRLDLKGIIWKQTLESGIHTANISDNEECTYCLSEKYFSYRRDQPSSLETQVAFVTQ